MEPFTFCAPTRILFGDGQLRNLPRETLAYGRRVLLVYGGASIKRSGLYDEIMTLLISAGCDVRELGGVHPNPELKTVYAGIHCARENRTQLVLAAGGGSVVDTAKAIAAGAVLDDDVWTLFTHARTATSALPVGVVLTIPAAGSESGNSAVITKEEGRQKLAFSADCIIPAFAVLEPNRTCSLPACQTAYGAADMLCHVLERYLCENGEDMLGDSLCEAVMRTIVAMAPAALRNPRDLHARGQLMWAATLAHNNLLGCGRRQDWSAHGIEHELSALYDIPHGAGMSLIMPAWMTYCAKPLEGAVGRMAVRVFGADSSLPGEALAKEGIRCLAAFFSSLGLPRHLTDLGIDTARYAEMARRCTGGHAIGSLCPLDEKAVARILVLAS